MNRMARWGRHLCTCALLALSMAGCAALSVAPAATATPRPTYTPNPTYTPYPSPTALPPTATPTSTPEATFTPEPTATPEATPRADSASVVIDFPSSLQSQDSYYNIDGPVWVFTIAFQEVNGVAATVDQTRMRIYATDGTVWGDEDYVSIYDDWGDTVSIELDPYGTDSYTSWVNSPDCQFCGATMVLDYLGTDAEGNTVTASTSFTMDN